MLYFDRQLFLSIIIAPLLLLLPQSLALIYTVVKYLT